MGGLGGWEGVGGWQLEQKLKIKSENINFLHVNNIWGFRLFIEQDISDKKQIAFSELVVLAVNWATTVTNNDFVSFCF